MAEIKRKLASQVGLPRLPRVGPNLDAKALARWATDVLRALEDQGVILTGVQDAGALMPIRSVIDFIGASVTDDQTNDRTQVSIGGGAGAAPVNAQYLVLALNGTLTAERVFVAGAGLASVDGGANGNFTVNIGIVSGSHLVANADDIDWTGVTLRKNSGANVGTRRRINLIEGTNITITEADDAVGDEVDVTISSIAALDGVPGAPGLDGQDGIDGEIGPPGPTGLTGASGAAGATGMAGVPGTDGIDGEDGLDGAPGTPGAIGPVGLMGPPGSDGDDGQDGSPGATGLTGSTGSQGLPGLDGLDGADGEMGLPGQAGPTGATGQQGIPGFDGDDGDMGFQGAQGIAGNDGLPGRPGFDGDDGEEGPMGAVGLTGNTGATGADGAQPEDLLELIAWAFRRIKFLEEALNIEYKWCNEVVPDSAVLLEEMI